MVVAWSTPPPSLAISLAPKFGFPTTTTDQWHIGTSKILKKKKIEGTLPRRSSTLFIHHVTDITCLSQRQEENDQFGTWIPQSCHGDDDLFQQATCLLLASHHRKLWVPADACGARDVRWRREFFVQTNRWAWELGQKVSN